MARIIFTDPYANADPFGNNSDPLQKRQVKAQHSTVISFLSPRLINNSWPTIVGGASLGEGGDTSKTGGGILSHTVEKKDAYEGDFCHNKLWHIFMVLSNLSSLSFLCSGLRAALTPSLRALIKTRVPNGP